MPGDNRDSNVSIIYIKKEVYKIKLSGDITIQALRCNVLFL